ncbi:hypothetical protein [Pseudomonas fluorescens]|jgi:hypothetical protein|uniref:hypothetical protein n=1 Tax=Pseudomonas fluorescens TaxID=294 RepID=UPI00099D0E72|nr:hypothetical protein [Pseudomonas fluorescens]
MLSKSDFGEIYGKAIAASSSTPKKHAPDIATLDWVGMSMRKREGPIGFDTSPLGLAPFTSTLESLRENLERAALSGLNSQARSKATRSPQGDKMDQSADTQTMNDITREEFNAKLETIEVKMDARIEAVSSKIEGFLAVQAERDRRLDAVLAQIGKDNSETKSSIGSMKSTLIVTAVSTVLAIVLGVAGFNTALTANMLSAFSLGKGDRTSATEVIAPVTPKATPSPAPSDQQK